MKKFKTIGLSLLVAACAVCLSLAFVACGNKDDDNAKYGVGEEGFYYYDGADSARYMLSLQSGTYMITANNETQYSGSYSYDEKTGVISFSGENEFTATIGENALSLDMVSAGYSFKAYKFFDVTYVDENGKVVATESVLNGQSAEALEIEKDGYWFIGWYEDSSNSSEFAFDTSIAGDTTVYGWYIEKNLTATEYEITLDYGDGITETVSTMNGAVWALPTDGILGWWVSATNKSEELTYKYNTCDVFTSDTTLFAVYSGIGASVTGTGITWENATGSDVIIAVYDEAGEQVLYATPSSTSGQYSYDFTALSSGTYTVEVASGSTSETLVYVVNGLDRVSMSSVDIIVNGDGRVISFAPVDGATGYEITITDGTKTVTENLGSHTYYNFSAWDMTKDGITFTVTAYATGYVSSVSDSYTYRLVLDDVSVDIVDDEVVWNRVENAIEYQVTVKDVDGNVYETFTTSATSYSLKYYDAGTYTISVQPVTDGYWSEASEYKQYSKVSLASPVITDITNYTVTWEGVDEAGSYVVMINGVEYEVVGTTTLVFSSSDVPVDAAFYKISVKAVGENDSSYSDVMTVTNGGFSSAVTYENGTVYWSYDVAATYYVVSVNGTDTTVSGGNSFDVTLNKAGDNEITVTAYDAKGSLGQATVDVYAYSVILDTNGATLVNDSAVGGVIYVAQGDAMNLGETYKDYADFIGWYTQADLTEGQSDEYEGKGSEVTDGTVFTGSRDMYLYAYWSYEYVTVTLDAGNGVLTDENGADITGIQVKYNSKSFRVPTPEAQGVSYDFIGWYSGTSSGVQYTDELGNATAALTFEYGDTMYAQYVWARNYTKTSYNGETVYSVTGTTDARYLTVMTVPEYVDDSGDTYPIILNSGAFTACTSLEVVNIPDSVRFISVTNGGYTSGSGAFAQCKNLKEVNLYSTGNAMEPVYFTEDGVLFHKMTNSEDVELLYYPYAKTTESYVIPSYVCNEDETDWEGTPVLHTVTTLPTRIFRDRAFREITIPSTVTYIASRAFYDNSSLRTVNFEAGGTGPLTMEDEAFYGCPYVLSIILPARYTEFNAAAFSGLSSLENVYVEEGSVYTADNGILLDTLGSTILYVPVARGGDIDTDTITSTIIIGIGDSAFAGNKKVTSVTIGADVTYIGTSAFDGCSGIKTITFNGNGDSAALTIKSRAFYGCTLVNEITLPQNLTVLEANAFGGCSNLSYVYFDSFAEATKDDLSFAANAFGSSNNIKTVEFGEYVPEISNFGDVFDGGALRYVEVDSENKNYSSKDGVLFNANQTTIIYYPRGIVGAYVVPDTVTEIGSSVFANRTDLTEITIGKNVNTIGSRPFDGCTFLTAIYVNPENTNFGNGIIYDDAGDFVAYDGVLYERGEITEDGETVGDLVTLICLPLKTTITDLVVPDTVTETASYAFASNSVIETVVFKYSGEVGTFTLGTYAFNGASALTSVVLPKGCEGVTRSAFYTCANLTYVYLPSSVTHIDYRAFYNCTSLVGDLSLSYVDGSYGIKLNEGLAEVGEMAFYGDNSLGVTIPSTVTYIGDSAFGQCWYNTEAGGKVVFAKGSGNEETSDGEIETSEPELTIDKCGFCNTMYLSEIEIPARTVSIGSEAFRYAGRDNTEVETILTFEEGCKLTEIGDKAFYYMYRLKKVNIPASITVLGESVFHYDYQLEDVTFGSDTEASKLTTIGNSAFRDTAIKSISIPSTVTTIGTYVFYACDSLTSFELETTKDEAGEETTALTSIGNYAFSGKTISSGTSSTGYFETGGWPQLTSFEIPASVISLGTYVFDGCTALTSVTFAEGINITSIGQNAFSGTSITEISIPDCVETISKNAFDGCANLTTVNFGTGTKLSSVGDGAFADCTALTSFTFPESSAKAIELGDEVFEGDTLTSLTLSSNIVSVGKALMSADISSITVADGNNVYQTDTEGAGCVLYSGTSIVFICYTITTMTGENDEAVETGGDVTLIIPEGVTEIADGAFSGHTEIQKVLISKDVGYIGEYAFYGCTGLKTVKIADGSALTGDSALGTYAFYGCSNLSTINLPEGITKIPNRCFYGCDLTGTTFPTSITFIDQYAFATSKIVNLKMEFSGTATIAGYAFYTMSSLETVEFSGGLTEFTGANTFRDCKKLTKVVLPASCMELGTYTFYNCNLLVSVDLPDGLLKINTYLFENCTSLKEISIPSTVTSLDNYCFYGCTSLVSVEIPDGVTSLGQYCFNGCTSLENIVWPQSLTLIDDYAFYNCSKLSSIEFGPYVETIDTYAFYGCKGLTSVSIPSSVTTLGGYAFYNCTSLEYAYTGNYVTVLGNYTFYGCSKLETVEFGSLLTDINQDCFNGCVSLENIEIPSSVTTIKTRAFSGCTSLTSVYLSSSISSVAANVFEKCNCDIYIDNTPNFVAGWTSTWNGAGTSSDPMNTGTVYYYSSVEPDFNEDGTGYVENYWHYDEDDNIVAWEFLYTTYAVGGGGYVLYDADADTIAYVCLYDAGTETSTVYAVTECSSTTSGYSVTLEDGDVFTVEFSGTAATVTPMAA